MTVPSTDLPRVCAELKARGIKVWGMAVKRDRRNGKRDYILSL